MASAILMKEYVRELSGAIKPGKVSLRATALAGFFFLVVLVMLVPGMIALKLLDWVYGKLYWRES